MTNKVPSGASWRILGWRMCEGSTPFGDYHVVDPELARFERTV